MPPTWVGHVVRFRGDAFHNLTPDTEEGRRNAEAWVLLMVSALLPEAGLEDQIVIERTG